MDTPGDTLRHLRVNEGLSRRALAREVGIDEEVVRGYESNRYVPRPPNAKRIADRLGVTVTEIWPAELF
jgi:ribosome-binding protein aMBF1 (putative translation factor)